MLPMTWVRCWIWTSAPTKRIPGPNLASRYSAFVKNPAL